jgi:hypothetical protein
LFLQTQPGSPDAYAGIARAYLKAKRIDDAAAAVAEGLSHHDSPRLRVAEGFVLFRQGKITEAEQEWVKVINGGGREPRAYLGLARVRMAIAMYKSAKKMLDKAHELDPDDPDIEEEWIYTLSSAERVKYLERSLAGPNSWDSDERESITNYLAYLRERERAKGSQGPCRLSSSVTSTEAPLVRLLQDPYHLRGFGLSVFLNGHKNKLRLDTGASGIVVKRSIAENAGIVKIAPLKIWGIGDKGGRLAYRGMAGSIRIGDLEFRNCPIEVVDGGSLGEEDGLIGSDVFSDFLIDIDFPQEKLRLSELPTRPGEEKKKLALKNEDDDQDGPGADTASSGTSENRKDESDHPREFYDRYISPEMQTYTRVFTLRHYLLIPTSIGDVPSKLFVLDTGAFNNTISPGAAREVTKVHNADITVEGLSGSVNHVYSANKAVLRFGRIKQENQDLVAFDMSHISDSAGTEISGFLGFAMLRLLDIKIDYRDALVDFRFDPERWKAFTN